MGCEVPPVYRFCSVFNAAPRVAAVYVDCTGCGLGRRSRCCGHATQLDCDDVGADVDPVAVLETVGFGYPPRHPVDGRSIGRNVVQPVPAIAEMNLAVLSGNESLGIGQRPVQIGISPDIDATLINLDEDGATVRQRVDVFYS